MPAARGPSEGERRALLAEIGPLPLEGRAWPRWVVLLAWLVLALVVLRLVLTAAGPAGQAVSTAVKASLTLCVAGLAVLAGYMQVSVTRITEQGIEQSWLGRRAVQWHDITFAKFIPLIASKKLICFTTRGRPVTFQAGSRELEIAFARIALLYRRR
ncbi:hypothetical protein [Yanghanlia caeni]|uniref:PH domain-containing protein n=1 Tax=Yanghanlia caeni TaxID=3064283 RepID=A0ABU1D2W0_9BURK|nr:hypothetical protein [Alcaligenaceae bacterium LG-2]NGR06914.1 hypothetical protein [bacterium SGD-2]HZH56805.1 hypothetical protein [Burkholderiaceae bacterium]